MAELKLVPPTIAAVEAAIERNRARNPLRVPPEAIRRSRIKRQAADQRTAREDVLLKLFDPAQPFPGVLPEGHEWRKPKLAMDAAPLEVVGWASQWGINSSLAEGQGFLGYAALSELAQRPEYRAISETMAYEMTREGIDLQSTGSKRKTERVRKIEDAFDRLRVLEVLRKAALHDGFFGRGHIYLEIGDASDERDELATSIGTGTDEASHAKVSPKNPLRRLVNVEPVWTYPATYDSVNPLKPDWFKPQSWFVMANRVHDSRLLTFVGREVPDLLKPAYSFGGLSLSQMAMPYVQNWLRTRQAVADLIWSYTVFVLKTNLSESMQGDGEQLFVRAELFNNTRSNQGLMMLDKDLEDFVNVSASIAGLHELQAQAQEHMACLTADTLVHTRRGMIRIDEVTTSDEVLTRRGYAPVVWSGRTGYADELIEVCSAGSVLRATAWHPIYIQSTGEFVPAGNVQVGDTLRADLTWRTSSGHPSCGAGVGSLWGLTGAIAIQNTVSCIGRSGKRIAALFRMETVSIWTMAGGGDAIGIPHCVARHVPNVAPRSRPSDQVASSVAADAKRRHIDAVMGSCCLPMGTMRRAWNAARNFMSNWSENAVSIAVRNALRGRTTAEVVSVKRIKTAEPVYNLEVAHGHLPEFYANGVLVHNSVSRIPLVKLLGIQPTGLNASSEGEIRVFYDWVHAYQEHLYRKNLDRILAFVQLSEFGDVDPEVTYEFKSLWQLDEAGEVAVLKTKADIDDANIAMGKITAEEARQREAADEQGIYQGIDLSEPLPEPDPFEEPSEEEPGSGLEQGASGPEKVFGRVPGEVNLPKPKDPSNRLATSITTKAANFGGAASGGFGKDGPTSDKVLPSSVGYEAFARKWNQRCALCVHFETPDACERVSGLISPDAWCELFEAAL